MTPDAAIKERVIESATSIEVGELADLDQLRAGARRRDHRQRTLAGISTLAVVAILLISVGSLLRDPSPNTVFAGWDEAVMVPVSVAQTAAGFVGVAPHPEFDVRATENRYVIVQSSEGTEWAVVEGLPVIESIGTVAVTSHQDTLHFLSTRLVEDDTQDGRAPKFELVHSQTDSLEELATTAQLLPGRVSANAGVPTPVRAVARDAGVAVSLRSFPYWNSVFVDELGATGVEVDDVCDMSGTATAIRYRLCGQTDWQDLKIRAQLPEPTLQTFVLFAPPEGEFAIVAPPDQEPDLRGRYAVAPLYPTSNGFGFSGDVLMETVDFVDWTEVDTGRDIAPLMAVRGNERVFRSFGPVQRFGPDDPVVGMAFSADDGATWEQLDISSLYDTVSGAPRSFTDLQAGRAGWVGVAQRRNSSAASPPGVDRTVTTGDTDPFVLSTPGYELAGSTPFGPATLTTSTGRLVREWDHLEILRPDLGGFHVTDRAISLLDDADGSEIVAFTTEQWAALSPESFNIQAEFDVLISANGREWSIAHTSALLPQVLAVGDTAAILRTTNVISLAGPQIRSELLVIPFDPVE